MGGIPEPVELSVAISADGRHVAFISDESNLVPGDSNGEPDVFVRDLRVGVTVLVSVAPVGEAFSGSPLTVSISADGRLVAFTNLEASAGVTSSLHVFVRDVAAGVTDRESVGLRGREANTDSYAPTVSADGRFVAFMSKASNLVRGDTNHAWDIVVRDRVAGVTQRVSLDSAGRQGGDNDDSEFPSISADGRFVAFESEARLSPADTDTWLDIYVRDRLTGTSRRASVVGPAGRQASSGINVNAALSADGQVVAFVSSATNLVPREANFRDDVFVRDLRTHVTRRVSVSSTENRGDSTARSRHCRRTAGWSRSAPSRRTWSPATPIAPRTCSSEPDGDWWSSPSSDSLSTGGLGDVEQHLADRLTVLAGSVIWARRWRRAPSRLTAACPGH